MSFKFRVTKSFRRDHSLHNKKTVARIGALVASIMHDPTKGIGKPEALRFNLSRLWSRRSNHKNRLICKIEDDVVTLINCRGHYD